MLGCTLVFSIPVGLGLIEKGDRPYFSKGLLIGLVTIPAGSLIGGLIAGFGPGMVLRNTVPVIILAVLLALGLKFIPEAMVKGCMIFGQFITIVIYIGLAAAAFEHLTGVVIIPGMADIMEGMNAIAGIGIVLLGTFPVLTILTKILDKPLNAVGRKIGLDKTSAAGLVFTLANSVPVYTMMKDMNKKGIIVNTAWLVPATAALGDHLGFTAGVRPEMITPVVIGKLAAGVLAVLLALFICRNMKEPEKTAAPETEAKVGGIQKKKGPEKQKAEAEISKNKINGNMMGQAAGKPQIYGRRRKFCGEVLFRVRSGDHRDDCTHF